MSNDREVSPLILEEARQSHKDWLEENKHLNTLANIFIAINVFILVSLLQLREEFEAVVQTPVLIILATVFIGLVCCIVVVIMHWRFDLDYYMDPDKLDRLSTTYDTKQLQQWIIDKYSISENQRKNIGRRRILLIISFWFTSLSIGIITAIYLHSLLA